MTRATLALATLAALPLLAACEGDLSAPSRPRTGGVLSPDAQESDRAFQRELEKPNRSLPTGGGGEFPGQSKSPSDSPDQKVITASNLPFARQPGGNLIPTEGTSARLPEARYPDTNWYEGPLPALGRGHSAGSTPVPGTAWAIEHSWGEVKPLHSYPSRDWPNTQANYVAATVKHNPTYFAPIQNRLPVPQNSGNWGGNAISALWEVPWMALQTAALPVLVFIDPPLSQVTTQRLGHDPVYLGHLPPTGGIVPAPVPGIIRWEYPFLVTNPNAPAGSPPATQPIAPTIGIVVDLPPTTTPAPAEPAPPIAP